MVIFLKNNHSPSSKNSEFDIPIGWKFMPTEEELIASYLSRKVTFKPLPAQIIKEIDTIEFYSHHPKDLVTNLVGNVCLKSNPCGLEPEWWYLFIHHDEYFHGRIIKKKAVGEEIGLWKSNGKEEELYDAHGNVFAYKIHFTFFTNSRKTHWKMEQYRLLHTDSSNDDHQILPRDEWVVARIRGA